MFGRLHVVSTDSTARADAQTARTQARDAKTETTLLKQEIERLLLITEALWEFVKEKGSYADEDLFKKILQIDAKDGKIDGKLKKQPPQKCPNCQHTLTKNKPFCIYCGKTVLTSPFQR